MSEWQGFELHFENVDVAFAHSLIVQDTLDPQQLEALHELCAETNTCPHRVADKLLPLFFLRQGRRWDHSADNEGDPFSLHCVSLALSLALRTGPLSTGPLTPPPPITAQTMAHSRAVRLSCSTKTFSTSARTASPSLSPSSQRALSHCPQALQFEHRRTKAIISAIASHSNRSFFCESLIRLVNISHHDAVVHASAVLIAALLPYNFFYPSDLAILADIALRCLSDGSISVPPPPPPTRAVSQRPQDRTQVAYVKLLASFVRTAEYRGERRRDIYDLFNALYDADDKAKDVRDAALQALEDNLDVLEGT
jgi:hypothetical protein